ncbi:MAG: hypothetical protein ACTSUK_07230 [Promethearchaeota archaeon]
MVENFEFKTKIGDLSQHCVPKRNFDKCFVVISLEGYKKRNVKFSGAKLVFSKSFWDAKNLKEKLKPRQLYRVVITPVEGSLEDFFKERRKDAKEVKLSKKLEVIEKAVEKRPNGCKYLGWFFVFLAKYWKNISEELLDNAEDLSSDAAKQVEDILKAGDELDEGYDALDDDFDAAVDAMDRQIEKEVDAQIEELADNALKKEKPAKKDKKKPKKKSKKRG